MVKRNLEDDLKTIEGATPGPWKVVEDTSGLHSLMPDRYRADDAVIERPPQSIAEMRETFFHTILSGHVSPQDARMMAEAREGWKEAVLLAMRYRDALETIQGLANEG